MNKHFYNWFKKKLNKSIFLITFSFLITASPIFVSAQCPLVSSPCTGTPVSGSGNVTIPAGATYYIPAGQTLSGNVTFGSGTSVLCIEGTWTGSVVGCCPAAGATINVYGSINSPTGWSFAGGGLNINIYPGATFTVTSFGTTGGTHTINNCGTFSTTNNFTSGGGTVNFYNYGVVNVGGTLSSTNSGFSFYNKPGSEMYVSGSITFGAGVYVNDGSFCVIVDSHFSGGSFTNNKCFSTHDYIVSGSNAFTNNYNITILGNYSNSGTNTINNGTLTVTGNFTNSGTFVMGDGSILTCVDWGTTGTTSGPASGCASIRASGFTSNAGNFTPNSAHIDFKDAGNPPPIGTPPAPMDSNTGNVGSATFTGTCTPLTFPACALACCTPPTPNIAGTTTICSGSSTTLTASGGTTYSWNTGATTSAITVSPVIPTSYTVTVTNASGCSATMAQSVTVNSPPTAGITGTTTICNGVSTTLTATGGGTYHWNTGPNTTSITVSPTTGTTYTVTVTDANGCTANATQAVTVNALPTTSMSSTNTACGGSVGTATVSSTGTAPLTYLWSPSGQTTSTATGLSAGSYIVTVTDGNGCTVNASVSVNNSTGPSITLLSQGNVGCTGAATGTATVSGSGGTAPLTYSWSPIGGTGTTATGLTAGTYICTVTDANGCVKGQSVTITQPASAINLNISSQSNVGCTGSATGSATVSGTGGTPTYTYLWSPGGNTTASVSGLTSGSYNVTITDANGCTAAQTVAITQPASALNAGIGSQSNVGCTGNATGSATVTGSGGTPSYTYNWIPGNYNTSSVTGLTAGLYTVTITDNNGCTATQTVAITQPASSLGATISSQTNVGCTGSATGSATVSGTGGTPTYNYSWTPGGNTTATVTGLLSGNYNVTITDNNGCVTNQLVTITQPASAVNASTSSIDATCGQSNGSASVTGSGGTPGYTYSWSPSGGTNSTATNLSAGSYNVTVTDANGCTINSLVSVNNANGPTASILSQTNVLCYGAATGSATVSGSGGTGALTYSWTPTGGTGATATGLTAGTYICTVKDASGCIQGQTVIITQPASAVGSTISSQSNVGCTGSATGSAIVSGTGGTPAYTYSWSPGGNTDNSVSGLTAGTYSVTVTDNNGCTTQQTVIITQPASNLGSIISSQTDVGCKGDASGTATVSGTGGTPLYTYSWLPVGGNAPNATGLTAGTYTVNVTDANGCTKAQIVTINEPLASLTSGITSQQNVSCNGGSNSSATITASGGTPGYSYNWSPAGGTNNTISGLTAGVYTCTITDTNGCTAQQAVTITQASVLSSVISSQTNPKCNGDSTGVATVSGVGGTPSYTYTWTPNVSNTGTATKLPASTYTVVITDSLGCTNATTVTITQPLPFTLKASSSGIVCAGKPVTLTVTPTNGTPPFNFTWLPGGPNVSPLVPTTYKVIGTDSSGCVSSVDSITISPLPAPVAGFDTLSSGMFNQKYNFTDQSTGGDSWYWDFGDGTTSTQQNPYHTYPGAGTYTVIQVVRNTSSGCVDTVMKTIVIRPGILIPNVFTPNHDGINDEFWIPSSGFDSFEIQIFNRWGTKLWETNSGEIRWDGRTSAGVDCPDGTYYFILKAVLKDGAGGKNYDTHGFVYLQRSGGK